MIVRLASILRTCPLRPLLEKQKLCPAKFLGSPEAREGLRSIWRQRRYPAAYQRELRLGLVLADLQRAGDVQEGPIVRSMRR
jgi:hypothetical protein